MAEQELQDITAHPSVVITAGYYFNVRQVSPLVVARSASLINLPSVLINQGEWLGGGEKLLQV